MSFDVNKALAAVMGPGSDHPGKTVEEYLALLLTTLINEDEGFSGKRPFGNSGWMCDLAVALIRAGQLPGRLEEDDQPEGYTDKDLVKALNACVQEVFTGRAPACGCWMRSAPRGSTTGRATAPRWSR